MRAEIREQFAELKAACGYAVVSEGGASVSAQAPFPVRSDIDTVFVVDKDPLFIDSLALQLRCYGYKVEPFSTSDGLADALKASTPLLIIMELSCLDDRHATSNAVTELQHGAQVIDPGDLPL